MRPSASALLAKAGLPALLLTDPISIRYCTGCTVSTGILAVSSGTYTLYVDARYTEEASLSALPGVRVRPLAAFADRLGTLRRWGIEADTLTVARLHRLQTQFKKTKFVQTSGLIEGFRRKKSPMEIRCLRSAEQRTRRLLRLVPSLLVPGITETGLAWILRMRAVEEGGDDFSFEPIVAFGDHTSRPHHHITDRRLVRGDLVQIDIGVRYKGYCGDLSDVFFTAPPTPEQRKAYGALKKAKNAAKKSIKAGVSNHLPDRIARDILGAAGLEDAFTHALGHGVGLEVHEGVTLSSHAKEQPLIAGEVVTVEPGVYFPGKFGMRLEDMVLVK